MKKILSLIAAIAVAAVVFTGCNNKPPFVKLAAAIDSINAQYEQAYGTKDKYVTYEKWENEVHFHIEFPGVIDRDAFEPIAANIKSRFLESLAVEDPFGLATEILDAKANVILNINGLNDTSYQVLIVTNEISAAVEQAHTPEGRLEAEQIEEVDTLTPAEVEHELLEGNAPGIGE